MAGIGSLVATLDVNSAPWKKGLGSAKMSLGKFAKGISGPLLAVGGALAAAWGAGASIAAAREQLKAQQKLGAVLKATGHAAGLTSNQMQDYASELQKVTNFGDEVTLSAMGVLATFKEIKGDVFKDAIASAQDMSSVLGTGLQGSIVQVGKALNDPIKGVAALERSGVSFTQVQKTQIKLLQESGDIVGAQSIILRELQGEFGGASEAMADPWVQMKNSVGDVAEVFGSVLLPSVNVVAREIGLFADGVSVYKESFAALGGSLAAGLEAALPVLNDVAKLIKGSVTATAFLIDKTNSVKNSFIDMGGGMKEALRSVSPQAAVLLDTMKALGGVTDSQMGLPAGTLASYTAAAEESDKLAKGVEKTTTAAKGMSDSLKATMQSWKSDSSQVRDNLAGFVAELEATGLAHLDIASLSEEFVRQESGFTDSLRNVSDEIRILKGEATKTSIELEKMSAAGVDDASVRTLRDAMAEKTQLEAAKKAAADQKSEVTKQIAENARLLEAKTKQLKAQAETVMASVRSPEEKIKREVARLKVLVKSGFLDKATAEASMVKFQEGLNGPAAKKTEQKFAGVMGQGSSEAFSLLAKSSRQMPQVKEQKETNKILRGMAKVFDRQAKRDAKLEEVGIA